MDVMNEMTDAQKGWFLWKKLHELQNLLWEIYHQEFIVENNREDCLSASPQDSTILVSKRLPQYPQSLECCMDLLADSLLKKHNDAFDILYLSEQNDNDKAFFNSE